MTVTTEQMEHTQHTQFAFEVFCKTLLRNKARNIHRRIRNLESREVLFSGIETDSSLVGVHMDNYSLDEPVVFDIRGQRILVSDQTLAKAIRSLLPKYQEVLLFSYFTDYSDVKISRILGISDRTVQSRRAAALRRMRERIGERDEE